MRTWKFAAALALGITVTGQATGQQRPVQNPQFEAERQAAGAELLKAEKLLNAGQRGPDSETCRLMGSYFLHIVKAAAAAGAETRIAAWSDLTREEQDAVGQKADPHIERNRRLHQVACSDNPR